MAVESISTIKSYLAEGKRPTASELADIVDTLAALPDADSEISSTSEKSLQNKVLYNELRVTETSSSAILSVNGVNYPIETIDASTLESKEWNDNSDTWHDGMKVLPILDPSKAYKIINTTYTEEGTEMVHLFILQNSGSFIMQFPELTATQDNVANGYYPGLPIMINEYNAPDFYPSTMNISTVIGQADWVKVTPNYPYHPFIRPDGEYNTYYEGYIHDENTTYYGFAENNNANFSISDVFEVLSSANETTGSISVAKSLKQKIAELEARVTALENNE